MPGREQVGVDVGHNDMAISTLMAVEIEACHEKVWPSWIEQLVDWWLQFIRSSNGRGKWQPGESAECGSEPCMMKQTAPGTVGADVSEEVMVDDQMLLNKVWSLVVVRSRPCQLWKGCLKEQSVEDWEEKMLINRLCHPILMRLHAGADHPGCDSQRPQKRTETHLLTQGKQGS